MLSLLHVYIFPFFFSCTTWHILSYYYLMRILNDRRILDNMILLISVQVLFPYRSYVELFAFTTLPLNYVQKIVCVSYIKIEIFRDSRLEVNSVDSITNTVAKEKGKRHQISLFLRYLSRNLVCVLISTGSEF